MTGARGTHRAAALGLAALITAAGGCARLSVQSDPPGATVLWSPTANEDDWRPWPPKAWAAGEAAGAATPLKDSGRYGDALWVTVEKEGYYRPLPKPVQLYLFRNEKLAFDLKETPETYASRMQAAGLVLFAGEWVNPQERGLVEYEGAWYPAAEAEALAMRAKGLVEYKGEWMTPERRSELFAADQTAAGLVLFKDRWVTPEVRTGEIAIDERVAAVAEEDYLPLEAPRPVGRIDSSDAELQLVNSSSQTVRFLFSGPMSREILVEPYSTQSRFFVLAGRYGVAVEVAAMDSNPAEGGRAESTLPGMIKREIAQRPSYLRHPLASGYKYILTYDAGTRFDYGPGEIYSIPQPELPADLPQIEIPDIEIPDRSMPPGMGGRPGGRPGGGAGGGGRSGGGGGSR